jgi:hypothetical protein
VGAQEFSKDPRQQVLWVVILLTDGEANAGHNDPPNRFYCPGYPGDPVTTWLNLPRCDKGYAVDLAHRLLEPDLSYDEIDYAYDQADYVGLPYDNTTTPPSGGQGALMYTIGLGAELDKYPDLVSKNPDVPCINGQTDIYSKPCYVDPYNTDYTKFPDSVGEGLGRIFLNYAAHVGNGEAFYSTSGSDLNTIFRLIGSNIATRLAK